MISHQHKCIFVHIPKTAGTSIEKLLLGPGSKKGSDHRFLSQYPSKFVNEYFKFCVVRNPYERLHSIFNYYLRGGNNYVPPSLKEEAKQWLRKRFIKNYHTDQQIAELMPKNFDDFCFRFLSQKENFFGNSALVPQVDYLSVNGKVFMDDIIKFETLEDGFAVVSKKIGINSSLSHHRKTLKNIDFRAPYTDRTREIVAAFYKEDISAFSYSFEQKPNL